MICLNTDTSVAKSLFVAVYLIAMLFFCRHASSTTDTKQNHQCSLCPSLVEQSNVDAVCNVVLKSAPKGAAGASTQDMP